MMDVSYVEWFSVLFCHTSGILAVFRERVINSTDMCRLYHTPWWSFGEEQDVGEDWQEATEED